MGRVLLAYGTPLTAVTLFKYLGRMLSYSKYNWTAVENNLQQSRGKWGRLVNILGREVADRQTTGRFYVAVVQAVLLFGSQTWAMTPRLEKDLEGFHHREVRRMLGMGPKSQHYGTWLHPPIGTALATVGLDEIGVYISCFQNKVAQ